MKVQELMSLLATMPKDAQVLLAQDENTMTFLQVGQVNQVLALGGVDAVLLGRHAQLPVTSSTHA
jgi:hypothetical protein